MCDHDKPLHLFLENDLSGSGSASWCRARTLGRLGWRGLWTAEAGGRDSFLQLGVGSGAAGSAVVAHGLLPAWLGSATGTFVFTLEYPVRAPASLSSPAVPLLELPLSLVCCCSGFPAFTPEVKPLIASSLLLPELFGWICWCRHREPSGREGGAVEKCERGVFGEYLVWGKRHWEQRVCCFQRVCGPRRWGLRGSACCPHSALNILPPLLITLVPFEVVLG